MDVTITPPPQVAMRGAYQGADQFSRELAADRPAIRSADADILPAKSLADGRARDLGRNDAQVNGAIATHRDSIVGSHFRLNARPNWNALGLTEEWAEEFQEVVESKFSLYAESILAWIDASRHDTLTGLARLAVGNFVMTGEVLASCEWMRDGQRPYHTAVQMIDTDRLSQPHGAPNTAELRGGVERNRYGAALAYHVRSAYPNDPFVPGLNFEWKRIPATKPWGRVQMIHIIERFRPDQTRGIADLVAALKTTKMAQKFKDIVLQNAVVNASYAATIESELPRDVALELIGAGAGQHSSTEVATSFLSALSQYGEGAKNIVLDGVKIPHLFPGTKLQLRPAGTAGGIGTGFEESLLRYTAAALGMSYEEFSRDFTKTNYSSFRAAAGNTFKYMQSRKKAVADRFATHLYWLWLEEALNKPGELPLPPNAPNYYEGQNKEAYGQCSWTGAARGQIDELKETQAALARVAGNLSTLEVECANLGFDWREVLRQKGREKRFAEKCGVDATTLAAELTQATTPEEKDDEEEKDNADDK